MRNTFTIMRRDLGAYFTSPIGYILMMVFVTLSVGLYITSFFAYPVADMRPYFDNLPIFLCVFIPAVTMRMWAEERKENTWEMLLTFPMKAWELVIGKFTAALIFFALTLAATLTIPMMLISMGDPDAGAIFSGYFGTFLLGAFFLSLGIFISGFFKDQIVAFAITLLVAFSFFLLGTGFIAAFIDDKLDGVGTMLSTLLGFFSHYAAFTRGVVDLADVVYFIVWTVIFLVLNVMFIDGRNRPGAKSIFGGAFAMSLVIGLLFNWLMTGQSIARADMTEDKIYTVSTASKNILAQVEDKVQVKVYISPKDKMPTQMKDLEQDILDKLEELRIGSDGKIEYTPVYLQVTKALEIAQAPTEEEEGEEETEEASVEKRMLEKGIQPFSVQAMSQDQSTTQYVYSSIGVAYKDKAEEIIPQVMPQTIQELEYRLVSTIYKLSLDRAPIVALVAPKEAVNIDPQMRAMLEQMGQPVPQSDDPYEYLQRYLEVEKYEVRRVELTKESPLPAEYDTLVVVNPRSFNERQRWEINRALHSGKPLVLAVQQYEWDYRPSQRGVSITKREENPEINVLLENYGLGVSKDLLMDESNVPLSIQTNSIQNLLGRGMQVETPMHIMVNPASMDNNTSITSRLSSIFYLWGTALEIDDAKLAELGLESKTVIRSSDRAWKVAPDAAVSEAMFQPPAESEMSAYPLMAVIEGQFPDAYASAERPAWPKAEPPQQQPGFPPPPPEDDTPEAPAAPVEAKAGKMVLLGTSETFRKNFLQQGNLDLFLNCVDAVSLSENIVNVRGRKPIDRSIPVASAEKSKTFWRLANYGLANILIAGIGIGYFMMRRQSRNAYTLEQMKK